MKNERQLLKAARELDEKALLDIYDHFAPKVYLQALQLCHDPVQADAVVGKVFERFLEEMANGRELHQGLKVYFHQSAGQFLS